MKKLTALFLCLLMILAGCGSEPALKDAVTTTPESVPETALQTTAPAQEGTRIETPLFSLSYDEALGWAEPADMEFDRTETRCQVHLVIPKPEGEGTQTSLSVIVQEDDCTYYRNTLHSSGFDPEIAAAGGTYETVSIGGYDFYSGINYGNPMYFARNEAAGMDITIIYYDQSQQDLPKAVIDTIVFTLPDRGKIDAPFFSAGESMVLEDHTAEAAGLTLTSRQIPFAEPRQSWDIFAEDMVIIKDKAYLLSGEHLFEYGYDGSAFTLIREIPLEEGYDRLEAAPDGKLYVSGFMRPLLVLEDGEQLSATDDVDLVALAPDGTWGLDYFYSGDAIKKLSVSDLTTQPMPFPVEGLRVSIDDKYIFLSGTSKVENAPSGHTLLVFDHSGKLLHQLRNRDDKSLGCITYACATKNGFMGLDGNMRDLYFWDQDGVFAGEVDTETLFGIDYPWLCAAEELEDGSLLITAPQRRPDGSGTELLVYQLTGF